MATNSTSVVESARGGDRFAFQSLVERYQVPIHRYIYRLTGDIDLARELTIKTFVTAHRKLQHAGRDLRFDAWLYRLATDVTRSALRWRRLRALLPRRRVELLASPDDDAEARAMQRWLRSLRIDVAACLLLWSMGGFSYDEIGRILRLSGRGVGRRMTQARQQLRRIRLSEAGGRA